MRLSQALKILPMIYIANSAYAQDVIEPGKQNDILPMIESQIIQSPVSEVGRRMNSEEFFKAISEYGFSSEDLIKKIDQNKIYDVYKTAISPGQMGIIATPVDSDVNSDGIFITQNPIVHNAALIDAETIRNEIMDAVMASVRAACDFSVRPSRISVSASAVGIVTLELEWESAEICDKI
jgi:hypothetical protein